MYTLDGFDDLCGAPQRAPLVGLATPNPDGTIGFGLNIVLPDGQNGSVEARITLPGLSGTWRDAGGNTGAFAFGGSSGVGLRPTATPGSGDITGVLSGTGPDGRRRERGRDARGESGAGTEPCDDDVPCWAGPPQHQSERDGAVRARSPGRRAVTSRR